jgi:hypothetical protein
MIDRDALAAEVQARIEAAVAERDRRRRHTAEVRAAFAQARRHGLAARHHRRIAEAEQRLREATAAGTADSWWEEPTRDEGDGS